MQKINLDELEGYDLQIIAEYLEGLEGNRNHFEICIDKVQYYPEIPYTVFWNYCLAAYAGQQLHDIADSFSLYVPCPKKLEGFRFTIEVSDLSALAQTLLRIAGWYTIGDDTIPEFFKLAAAYYNDAWDDFERSACWGLLRVADDYAEEE